MHIQRQSETFAYRMHKASSFDQQFVDNLRKEFRDWWASGDGQAAFRQHPRVKPYFDYDLTQENQDPDEWKRFRRHEKEYQIINNEMKRRGPIGWWPNVENFLQAKYPAANKNHRSGWEEAGMALDNPAQKVYGKSPYETGMDAVSQHGYDPAEVAAGMVLLHNQSHPLRGRLEETDKQRLVDIFNKRQQMQRAYEQRQKTGSLTQDIVDRLNGEFHRWWRDSGQEHRDDPDAWPGRGPIGHWPNVENFLADNYPAAHKGFQTGYEDARRVLDNTNPQRLRNNEDLYETGPEAVHQYGYDPAEIAAGMVLLHNKTHPFRGTLRQEDQDRLVDIFQKRQKMQRDYEERMKQQGQQQELFTKGQLLYPEQKETV